jgi:hypothetical protein
MKEIIVTETNYFLKVTLEFDLWNMLLMALTIINHLDITSCIACQNHRPT